MHISKPFYLQTQITDTIIQYERSYKKTLIPRLWDPKLFNTKLGVRNSSKPRIKRKANFWKRLWSWTHLWRIIERKGNKDDPLPLKGCGWVGYKTFISNIFYWKLYHESYQSKFFFPWLLISFNTPNTPKTSQMAPGEGLHLLSWKNISILWIDHPWSM